MDEGKVECEIRDQILETAIRNEVERTPHPNFGVIGWFTDLIRSSRPACDLQGAENPKWRSSSSAVFHDLDVADTAMSAPRAYCDRGVVRSAVRTNHS